jgi:hypothetical protein
MMVVMTFVPSRRQPLKSYFEKLALKKQKDIDLAQTARWSGFPFLSHFGECQVTKEMRRKREENRAQSAKAYRETLLEQQNDERRFRDALKDDEVREALKLMHERDERMRKKQEENGAKSAKVDRRTPLLEQEERQFRDALENDEVREALILHARDEPSANALADHHPVDLQGIPSSR